MMELRKEVLLMSKPAVLIILLLLILLSMAAFVYVRCREQLADRMRISKVRPRDMLFYIVEYLGEILGG